MRKYEDGASILLSAFGTCGIPERLIDALSRKGSKNLTCISNNPGMADCGIGHLLQTHQIRKTVGNDVGENKLFEKQVIGKEIEVELNPQGTLAERIRAGRA